MTPLTNIPSRFHSSMHSLPSHTFFHASSSVSFIPLRKSISHVPAMSRLSLLPALSHSSLLLSIFTCLSFFAGTQHSRRKKSLSHNPQESPSLDLHIANITKDFCDWVAGIGQSHLIGCHPFSHLFAFFLPSFKFQLLSLPSFLYFFFAPFCLHLINFHFPGISFFGSFFPT